MTATRRDDGDLVARRVPDDGDLVARRVPDDGDLVARRVPDDGDLVARLRLAVGRLNRRMRLASNDIPPLQFSALTTLEQHGPLRPGELAQREAVTAPTMTKVLAALAERGLVERVPDAADARSIRVLLTPRGREALARIRCERAALLATRLDRLDPGQRAAIMAALPALEALVADE